MLLRYAVSFESDLRPVRTARGEIDVPNPRLGVRRALEAAQVQCPNTRWRSLVVVLEKVLPEPESVEVVPDLGEEVPDLEDPAGRVSSVRADGGQQIVRAGIQGDEQAAERDGQAQQG